MLRKQTDQIVIKPRISWTTRVALVIVVLLVFAAGIYQSYQHGLESAEFEQAKAQKTELQLRDDIKALQKKNEGLAASLAIAKRQIQVDQSVYAELSEALESSSLEISELNKEMSFYRSIISPNNNREGIQIQNLVIEKSPEDRQYHYTLVLIQALKHQSLVKGNVDIKIEGIMKGTKKSLNLANIGTKIQPVNFKYFQNLEGLFTLPKNFMPVKVYIAVNTKRKNAPRIERWYPWPSA